MTKTTLADRRAQLVERCEQQRIGLVMELHAIGSRQRAGSPLAGALLARLLAHKRLALGMLGGAAAFALARPARLVRIVRFAAAGIRMVRGGMAFAARHR